MVIRADELYELSKPRASPMTALSTTNERPLPLLTSHESATVMQSIHSFGVQGAGSCFVFRHTYLLFSFGVAPSNLIVAIQRDVRGHRQMHK